MQCQQNQLRVEAARGLQRRLNPMFDLKRKLPIIRAGECLGPDHTIADDLGCGSVRLGRGLIADRMILEEVYRGQLDGFGHEPRMQVDRSQSLIELAQIMGPAKYTE
jgi:hypothetical protein